MADYQVTISIPEELYEFVRDLARSTDQPVDRLLQEYLMPLPLLAARNLSAHDYAHFEAAKTGQSIEKLYRQRFKEIMSLPPLPQDEESELAALRFLSEDALWTIAKGQMPVAQQERRSSLLERNQEGGITAEELAELDELLERGNRLMVRKAEAAEILRERGHAVRPEDLAAPHE